MPPAPVRVVVEITGTPGTGFEGSLGTAPSQRAISGTVPAEYAVETAVALAVSATKTDENGELTVRVLRDGREVARRTTTAPFGTVLLVYQAPR
jgi:acyl-CoA thioesterase